MHSSELLTHVITAQEAAAIWGLSRNAISDACRRGALPCRKSGRTWLVTLAGMLEYQHGRYVAERVPQELRAALGKG